MVGTVGRVLDLISRHSLMLHSCRYVVLDEADEMLDLGFLEDVEKILSLTPERPPDRAVQRDDARPDPRAGRAPPVRPGDDQGQGRDADDRHGRAVLPARPSRRRRSTSLVRVLEAERPRQAIVFVRTKIRTRAALPHAARQGHERQGAARRHDPGRARRRDDLLQGRPRADPRGHRRRRPRARHRRRSPTSSTSTCRPRPTSTCTGSGAPAASGARAGRSRSSSRARGATSRRSSATPARTIAPWAEGAHVAPAPTSEPPAPPPQAARRQRRQRRSSRS